ncbi:hypothetical protein MG290_04500 [Flavobacterium sp. CBA20B-1]|uniref:hypothetical protein n=1 Tax=unclassified Flavobacterium TaxID=196869 RepID=UPI00222556C7|nr:MULTISPECIES: hypothetical protein [unclassified Flavobacterium]WCM42944.1 hypothetical protein MG290_04500 [Flavobacterium sp. CBA20B-1]
MKKLLLMASSVLLTLSCGTSDDSSSNNSNNNSSSKITPPAWIQGTWVREDVSSIGYTLSSDDICNFVSGTTFCQKEYINLYKDKDVAINVAQSISDTEYKCSITVSMQTATYHFQKLSPTTIKILQEPGGISGNILKKQ